MESRDFFIGISEEGLASLNAMLSRSLQSERWTSCQVPIFEFLWGKRFDMCAITFILALKPCELKINWTALDVTPGRVNVWTDDRSIITSITYTMPIPTFNLSYNGDELAKMVDLDGYRAGEWGL